MSKYEWYLLIRSKCVKKFLKLLLTRVPKCLEMLTVGSNDELSAQLPRVVRALQYQLCMWFSLDFSEEGFFPPVIKSNPDIFLAFQSVFTDRVS